MLSWIVRKFIGGKSGKREAAWKLFYMFFTIMVYAVVKESMGAEMLSTFALLTIVMPTTIVGVLVAHGIEHLFKNGFGGGE